MKINELLNEGFGAKSHGTPEKVRDRAAAAMPGVYVQRGLRNTDPYMQYRYSMAVASARGIANGDLPPDAYNQESAFAENLTQVMYAAEDEETIKLASKMMGVTPTRITDNASREPNNTNTVSPVSNWNKKK